MDEMENKLNAILGNPQMMQQIMAMAQSMGQPAPQEEPAHSEPPVAPAIPADAAMLTQIAGFARSASVDKNQQLLLKALSPYLSTQRVSKLEKAMRAAKIAGIAAKALSGGLPALTGR